MKDTKLIYRLFVAFAIVIGCMAVIATISINAVQDAQRNISVLAKTRMPLTAALSGIYTSMVLVDSSESYLAVRALNTQERVEEMETFKPNIDRIRSLMVPSPQLLTSERARKDWNVLTEALNIWLAEHDRFEKYAEKYAADPSDANYEQLYLQGRTSYAHMEKAEAAVQTILDANQQRADALGTEALQHTQDTLWKLAVGLVLVFCIAISVAWMLSSNITRALYATLKFSAAVAQGDLDAQITLTNKDEFKTLAESLQAMVQNLKDSMEKARKESAHAKKSAVAANEATRMAEQASEEADEKSERLLQTAQELQEIGNVVTNELDQLSMQISQSEQGAEHAAARVAETANTMAEMNTIVLDVARNAEQASSVVHETRKKAEDGAAIVSESIQSVLKAREDALALKVDMQNLSQHALAIDHIMSVISDIADQTNLLALNAAIEAARAGDAGRGFAVVADEVRKLAEKTMVSTSDVGNAIRAIQLSTEKSMQQVDETVKNIEESTAQVEKSGIALREIVQMVDNASTQTQAIATASEEQSATSMHVHRTITDVTSIVQEMAQSMQSSARAIASMTEQAQILTSLIGKMNS